MDATANYQKGFGARWGHLSNPHVRTLAWLLDAPDLLDAADPHWAGQIASTGPVTPEVAAWLAHLDNHPAPLDAALGERTYTRLGLYAEKLMAFYYREQGTLVAHGLQVRASRNDTIGEFDFLLDDGAGVEHIEFATKLYLLQDDRAAASTSFDAFVGPNLADSLGKKMRKVIERQLTLGQHPAAQAILPRPVLRARALVKGWLFYPFGTFKALAGIGSHHCRGFWCAADEVETLEAASFAVLPRLQWLAPFQSTDRALMLDRAGLHAHLAAHFVGMGTERATPLLVATVAEQDGLIVETARGFIVPDGWRERASAWTAAPRSAPASP